MYDGDHRPDAAAGPAIGRQYTAGSATRQRSRGAMRRRIFFGLASIWGFIAGVVGLLAASGIDGERLASEFRVGPALIPAFLIAGAGGLVMSAAYRESKRRGR
jgi:hypothetical protein